MPSASDPLNVLLVGGGGREHALAWKLKQSPRLGTLFTTDSTNPGLAAIATAIDVPFEVRQPFRLQRFCDQNRIGLVVIGPEEPLAAGMADCLITPDRVVFGPVAAAARLEADKAWCKQLMRAASVPMAEGRVFSDPAAARAYVETREDPPVIKASGLAKGKGVIVPATIAEALNAIERIMVKREFGDAGKTVVIEERLEGRECSMMALVDGRTLYMLEPCQDHKRLEDNDKGPNTGGMGVFCPGGITDEHVLRQVESEILVPTLDAMRRDGIDFRGVLYAGVMITAAGPKALEFNVRFGDPECQALMMRLDTDLIDLFMATGRRHLDEVEIRWSPAASVCVVLASAGYPGTPKLNVPIEGIDAAAKVPGVQVFHAATKRNAAGQIVTAGGRVLSVAASGDTVEEARRRAYQAADLISFQGKTYRRDIASGSAAPRTRERVSRGHTVIAAIGLGSNLGDRAAHVDAGFAGLARLPRTTLTARARVIQSPPMLRPGEWKAMDDPAIDPGGDYLNSAALIQTTLTAHELLAELHHIERACGRDRSAEPARWLPRTLDLDLLLYGDAVIQAEGLTVPHPGLRDRLFVLEPLAEIAGGLQVPGAGKSVDQLLADLLARTPPTV